MDHAFVIPVYLAAPRLGALIESLRAQAGMHSEILLTTSTPSAELYAFAKHRSLPLRVNPHCLGIASDWNFALAAAKADLVTIAHQDDLFGRCYVSKLSSALRDRPGALLAFCDYAEHSPWGARPANINLRIKRALCRRAFGKRKSIGSVGEKERLLSLGNPICCPSVMFDRSALRGFSFPSGFRSNLDWMAWAQLARRPGEFVYVREKLVSKGVHADSATTASITNRERHLEDRVLFDTFWPQPVAVALAALYRFSYLANRF